MIDIKLLSHNASLVCSSTNESPPRPVAIPFNPGQVADLRMFKTIVCIGIGGSYAGLKLIDSFLAPIQERKWNGKLRFARTTDELLALGLSFDNTEAFVVTSKSGATPETMDCLAKVKELFGSKSPTIVYQGWGPAESLTLPIPDNIGGRFSIWATLLPIAIKYGTSVAQKIVELSISAVTNPELNELAGSTSNFDLSNIQENSATGKCILVYDLPTSPIFDYIQQLEMESLGKTNSNWTGNIVFGGYGPNLQHSIMQLIHQGSANIPCEFIVVNRKTPDTLTLWANASAQSAALKANGTQSIIWVLGESIKSLVELLTVFELRTIATARSLGINPFDQPGVELGKKIARGLIDAYKGGSRDDELLQHL